MKILLLLNEVLKWWPIVMILVTSINDQYSASREIDDEENEEADGVMKPIQEKWSEEIDDVMVMAGNGNQMTAIDNGDKM